MMVSIRSSKLGTHHFGALFHLYLLSFDEMKFSVFQTGCPREEEGVFFVMGRVDDGTLSFARELK